MEIVKPKFRPGDLVETIEPELARSHFRKGKAIVSEISRNTNQKGNDSEWSYSLHFIGLVVSIGTVAWYHDSNLKMIEKGLGHNFEWGTL